MAAIAKTQAVDEVRGLLEGWEWVPLGSLCESIVGGGTPDRSNSNYWGGDIPWASVKDLKTDKLLITQEFITLEGLENSAAKLVEPGTVIVATRMGLGKVCTAQIRVAINQDLKGLILSPKVLAEYLTLHLRSCASEFERRGSGATVKGIKLEELRVWAVPLPFRHDIARSLEVQHRIVVRIEALLTEVERARMLLIQMRHDSDLLMKSALKEVLGRMRDGFEVAKVPPNQVRCIDDVARLERGKFSHRPRNDQRFFGGTVPWVQIQNLPSGYGKYINEYMNTLNDQGVAISKLFPRGTLVLSIAATIGAVGILSFDACFPDSLVGVTPQFDNIDVGFLYWQLVFLRDHLEAIAPSAAQKNINLQILSRINLWIPPLEEQKAINNYLDSVQSYVAEIQQRLDQDTKLLDQLEKSILQQAFRGKL